MLLNLAKAGDLGDLVRRLFEDYFLDPEFWRIFNSRELIILVFVWAGDRLFFLLDLLLFLLLRLLVRFGDLEFLMPSYGMVFRSSLSDIDWNIITLCILGIYSACFLFDLDSREVDLFLAPACLDAVRSSALREPAFCVLFFFSGLNLTGL